MPSRPRASDVLLAMTSSRVIRIPAAAASIAMRVARQDARPARNNQPGLGRFPSPPSSAGISVATSVPFAWRVPTRSPPSQRAAAGSSACMPARGRWARTARTRCIAFRTCSAMVVASRLLSPHHSGRIRTRCQANIGTACGRPDAGLGDPDAVAVSDARANDSGRMGCYGRLPGRTSLTPEESHGGSHVGQPESKEILHAPYQCESHRRCFFC